MSVPRLTRPVAGLAASALAVGVLVTGAPTAQAAAAPPALARLSTFTLNVEYSLTTAQAISDAMHATTLGSVGGFQEFSGPRDREALAKALTAKGWSYYMPRGAGSSDPIAWDAHRFTLLGSSSVMINPELSASNPARYINSVRLRDATSGNVLAFINTHTIANASRDAMPTDPSRVPYLRRAISMLRSTFLYNFATTENVVMVGDLNINYLADRRRQVPGFPTAELGDLVNFDMPLSGSRGPTSLLDYVMSAKDAGGLTKVASRIVTGFNSDHDAVAATYQPQRLLSAPKTLRNTPSGDSVHQRLVVDRLIRAVQDAEPRSTVRIASARLNSPQMAAAISAARARGVTVATKWRKRVHSTVVTVSQAGGAHDIVLIASRTLGPKLVLQSSTLQIRTRLRAYYAYARWFDRL